MLSDYFLNEKKIECKDTGETCVGYKEYLQSRHWKNLRNEYIKPETVCECCGKSGVLQLHHKSYKRLGCERRTNFKVLCPECHKKEHELKDKRLEEKKIKDRNKRKKKAKNKKHCVVVNQMNLKEASPQKLVKSSRLNKFALECTHCFEDSGIQWCELGYKKCPLLKCGDYKRKDGIDEAQEKGQD